MSDAGWTFAWQTSCIPVRVCCPFCIHLFQLSRLRSQRAYPSMPQLWLRSRVFTCLAICSTVRTARRQVDCSFQTRARFIQPRELEGELLCEEVLMSHCSYIYSTFQCGNPIQTGEDTHLVALVMNEYGGLAISRQCFCPPSTRRLPQGPSLTTTMAFALGD